MKSKSKNNKPRPKRTALKGTGQKLKEAAKKKFRMGSRSLGDAVEAFGKRLQKNGYSKFGAKIKKIGGTIEHMASI